MGLSPLCRELYQFVGNGQEGIAVTPLFAYADIRAARRSSRTVMLICPVR